MPNKEKMIKKLREKAEQYGQGNLEFTQPQPQTSVKPRELTPEEKEDGAL